MRREAAFKLDGLTRGLPRPDVSITLKCARVWRTFRAYSVWQNFIGSCGPFVGHANSIERSARFFHSASNEVQALSKMLKHLEVFAGCTRTLGTQSRISVNELTLSSLYVHRPLPFLPKVPLRHLAAASPKRLIAIFDIRYSTTHTNDMSMAFRWRPRGVPMVSQ